MSLDGTVAPGLRVFVPGHGPGIVREVLGPRATPVYGRTHRNDPLIVVDLDEGGRVTRSYLGLDPIEIPIESDVPR